MAKNELTYGKSMRLMPEKTRRYDFRTNIFINKDSNDAIEIEDKVEILKEQAMSKSEFLKK